MLRIIFSCYLNIFYRLNSLKAILKIISLFSKPSAPKKQRIFSSILQSATHFKYSYKNRVVTCYQWGKGDYGILLIQELEGNVEDFMKLISTLVQNGNTVFAFDAPANGSYLGKYTNLIEFKEIVKRLIYQKEEIKSIVGYSLGGIVGVLTLKDLEKQTRTYKLILINVPTDLMTIFHEFICSYKLPSRVFIDGIQYMKNQMGMDLFNTSLINVDQPMNAKTVILIHNESEDLNVYKSLIRRWYINEKHILVRSKFENYKILEDPAITEPICRVVSVL